jgi:hypothetical protein
MKARINNHNNHGRNMYTLQAIQTGQMANYSAIADNNKVLETG